MRRGRSGGRGHNALLAPDPQVVLHVRHAAHQFRHILGRPFRVTLPHRSVERDHTILDAYFDVGGVDVVIGRETLADVLEDALVGALVVLRTAAAIRRRLDVIAELRRAIETLPSYPNIPRLRSSPAIDPPPRNSSNYNASVMCRWCKGVVSGRRRTFCSDACVHEFRLRSSPTYLRECVFERDKGICALCELDTHKLRRRVMRMPFAERMRELKSLHEHGMIHPKRKSWWEADHILPVVEGGDSNLENMRTLCIPCHRGVTTELRLRRKSGTRIEL